MSDLFSSVRTAPKGMKLSDSQRLDWLRLYRSENIGPRTFWHLINKFGGASAALDALPSLVKTGKKIVICSVDDAKREIDIAHRQKCVFIARGEPDYPSALATIDGCPPLIAVKGCIEIFQSPFVAIVGSRNASAVGMKMAEILAHGLNDAGFSISSGLARGIDTRAHMASVGFGTVAVLAGGLDKPYPPENLKLLEEITERGAVIAEMPFGWEPRGRDFPRRNRIISGLAYGTVIVEAARKSGSLITAKFALEQGREVFAVPGSPLDPRADGTNDLIKNGANLVVKADDIVSVLAPMVREGLLPDNRFMNDDGVQVGTDEALWDELDFPDITTAPLVNFPLADAFEEPRQIDIVPMRVDYVRDLKFDITNLLGAAPIDVDELIRITGCSASDIQTILLDLEMEGLLERHSGNKVSLV